MLLHAGPTAPRMPFESFACSTHGLCALLGKPIDGLTLVLAISAFAALAIAATIWCKAHSEVCYCLLRECRK